MMSYTGQFTLSSPAVYKGSVYSDALIAFYKLANGESITIVVVIGRVME